MKHFIFVLFIFTAVTTVGQGLSDDLPKPVVKTLNNHYKNKEFTLVPISDRQRSNYGVYYAIHFKNPDEPTAYLHVGKVNTCRTGGCSNTDIPATAEPTSEYFDYLIVFNTTPAVETIKVFNYQASYGHEIAARGWLKQFRGYKGERPLEPGKDIDSLSGATISVRAITSDVEWKTKQLKELIR